MTTAQNTQLWQDIGAIADDESLMKRLSRFAAKLAKEKKDSSLMTKDDFFAMIERGERAYENGECTRLQPGETVTQMLRRRGYDL